MQIFTEKWTDLHNEIDLNSLNDDSNKDGFVRMDLAMPKLYVPKYYLSTNGYLKDQKFSIDINGSKKTSNGEVYLKYGYFVMNNVHFSDQYFFIKENKYQDYNFGIVDNNPEKSLGRFLPEAEIKKDLNQSIIIEEPCFLCLPSRGHYPNYGAFLSQVTTQIHEFRKINKTIKIAVNKTLKWQNTLLKYFFPDLDFIEIDVWPMKNSLFFKKIVTSFAKGATILSKNDIDFFKKNSFHKDSNRRIFLSRLKQNGRKLVNEDKVVDFLKSKNFEIIFPEEKDTRQIAEILGEAEYVFGTGGAGMFNSIFCKPNTKFLSIEGGRWATVHSKMFSAIGLDYSIIQPHPTLPLDQIKNLGQCESYVNIDEFINFVETNYNL
jgi:hypothetical protein